MRLAKQAGLPLVELPEPKTVDLDGCRLARVMWCTALVTLLVSGNHHERIQFFSQVGGDGEIPE